MKVVQSNIAFSACGNIGQVFKMMFPHDSTASDFTCGATKVSYLITYGIAPYFKGRLIQDVVTSGTGYTLHYDETTTVQTVRQMDFVIRYWSVSNRKIVVNYLGSIF